MNNNNQSKQASSIEELEKNLSDTYNEFLKSFYKNPQEVNNAFNAFVQSLKAMEENKDDEIEKAKTR